MVMAELDSPVEGDFTKVNIRLFRLRRQTWRTEEEAEGHGDSGKKRTHGTASVGQNVGKPLIRMPAPGQFGL